MYHVYSIVNEELPVHVYGHVVPVGSSGPMSWPSTLHYPKYHILIVLDLL